LSFLQFISNITNKMFVCLGNICSVV